MSKTVEMTALTPLETELLAALKECALEIAQLRNVRRLTLGEQIALDHARDVIAKAEARP